MTVKELIESLKDIKNQDLPVAVCYSINGKHEVFDEDVYPYVTIDDGGDEIVVL